MARRVTTIRLLMQGYYAIQVAELLHLHHETVSEYVKKFNEGGIGHMLKRWGLRYTRPTYTLKRADPNKQKTFKQELSMIKKTW